MACRYTSTFNFKMDSCHQGKLCSRKLSLMIGKFDTSFGIDMDYDLILHAYRTGASCDYAIDWHKFKNGLEKLARKI